MANHRAKLLLGFTALIFAGSVAAAHAASPTFIVTWKAAGSYAPSNFQGKILPTYGSQITASVELLSNGSRIDLSGQTIYWYLNDTLLGGGVGAQSMSFPPFGQAPNSMTLKVELPSYHGATLTKTIIIPMVQPQVVIVAPYPDGNFSINPVTVTAMPYFFNTVSPDNLSYAWAINNQSAANSETPEVAQITIPGGTPSGTSFPVAVTVRNVNDSTQATASENLTYQTSL